MTNVLAVASIEVVETEVTEAEESGRAAKLEWLNPLTWFQSNGDNEMPRVLANGASGNLEANEASFIILKKSQLEPRRPNGKLASFFDHFRNRDGAEAKKGSYYGDSVHPRHRPIISDGCTCRCDCCDCCPCAEGEEDAEDIYFK